jgi:hypothetical protein
LVHVGRVVGVWELADGTVDVRLFPEAPGAVTDGLEAEVEHLATCTGRALSLTLGVG